MVDSGIKWNCPEIESQVFYTEDSFKNYSSSSSLFDFWYHKEQELYGNQAQDHYQKLNASIKENWLVADEIENSEEAAEQQNLPEATAEQTFVEASTSNGKEKKELPQSKEQKYQNKSWQKQDEMQQSHKKQAQNSASVVGDVTDYSPSIMPKPDLREDMLPPAQSPEILQAQKLAQQQLEKVAEHKKYLEMVQRVQENHKLLRQTPVRMRGKYPHESYVTAAMQKEYLVLYDKYIKYKPAKPTPAEVHELTRLRELQMKVSQEQEEFMEWLEKGAQLYYEDYQYIHPIAKEYMQERNEVLLSRVKDYPRYYIQLDTVPIIPPKRIPEDAPTLSHQANLLQVGMVPKVINPNVNKRVGNPSLLTEKNVATVCEHFPAKQNSHDWVKPNKPTCSNDSNAEKLSVKYEASVVISPAGLMCLLDNHQPSLARQWELPVIIKEHTREVAGVQKIHQVVYIDKPFPSKMETVRDQNTKFHQLATKSLLQLHKHMNTYYFEEWTEVGGKELQDRHRAPVQPYGDVEQSSEVDICDLESFGTFSDKETQPMRKSISSSIVEKLMEKQRLLLGKKEIVEKEKAKETKDTSNSSVSSKTVVKTENMRNIFDKKQGLSDNKTDLEKETTTHDMTSKKFANEVAKVTECIVKCKVKKHANKVPVLTPKPEEFLSDVDSSEEENLIMDLGEAEIKSTKEERSSDPNETPQQVREQEVTPKRSGRKKNIQEKMTPVETVMPRRSLRGRDSDVITETHLQTCQQSDRQTVSGNNDNKNAEIDTKPPDTESPQDVGRQRRRGRSKVNYDAKQDDTSPDIISEVKNKDVTSARKRRTSPPEQKSTTPVTKRATRSSGRFTTPEVPTIPEQKARKKRMSGEPTEDTPSKMKKVKSQSGSDICLSDGKQDDKVNSMNNPEVAKGKGMDVSECDVVKPCSEKNSESWALPSDVIKAEKMDEILFEPNTTGKSDKLPEGNPIELKQTVATSDISTLEKENGNVSCPSSPRRPTTHSQKSSLSTSQQQETDKIAGTSDSLSVFDAILQQQEKLNKFGKEERKVPEGSVIPKRKLDVIKTMAMAEDPSEYVAPVGHNITYNLWKLGETPLIIRCNMHGHTKNLNMPTDFRHIVAKMEYQPHYGYEQVTASEAARQWISSVIRKNCSTLRVRINAFTSDILMFDTLDINTLLPARTSFRPQASMCVLNGIFEKLKSLPVGSYLLSHTPGSLHANIKKSVETNRGVYDLHLAYESFAPVTTIPWVPIDPSIILPVYRKYNRVPATFTPFMPKPGQKSVPSSQPKGKKKKKKKGNRRQQ